VKWEVVVTEIHVVTAANKSFYAAELHELFKVRHEVFVREKGWTALDKPDGLDRDAYDDHHTTYIIALEGDRVVGGQRLRPTNVPHLLQDHFASLAAVKGVPVAPDVWEWSRYFVIRERRTSRTDCRLLAAIQQFAIEEGITKLQAIVETWWLPRWTEMGFRVRPLGLPELVEGQWCIAALIDVSNTTLRAICDFAKINPKLVRDKKTQPLTTSLIQ
jgi:acyl-homoserine lactone synthase